MKQTYLILLNIVAKAALHVNEWCERRAIGKAALDAYRRRTPDAHLILQDRLNQIVRAADNHQAVDTLDRMRRQMELWNSARTHTYK